MKDEMDPDVRDDDIHRMEQEEPLCCHPGLKYQDIVRFSKRAITKTSTIVSYCQNTGLTISNRIPSILTPTASKSIPAPQERLVAPYIRALLALEGARWIQSDRGAADSQPHAKKVMWGFFPQIPVISQGTATIRSAGAHNGIALLAYDLKRP